MFVRHLGPCAYPSYWDMGQIPVSALWGIVYARWGQRLGQKEAESENNNLCKTKIPEILRFRGFLARREGFEPPAFWSVGCLKHKSEPFRLRFALFSAICSEDFPLFPPSPACFFRILGQKWVKSGSKFPRRRLRGRSGNNGCKHNTHSKGDSESAANRLFHVILLKYNVYCFLRRQVNTVPRFVQP